MRWESERERGPVIIQLLHEWFNIVSLVRGRWGVYTGRRLAVLFVPDEDKWRITNVYIGARETSYLGQLGFVMIARDKNILYSFAK